MRNLRKWLASSTVSAVAVCVATVGSVGSAAESVSGAGYYTGGLGTPVGAGGAEVVEMVSTAAQVSIGVGLGLFAMAKEPRLHADVLQWSVMPRFIVAGDSMRHVNVGVGVSGGGYGVAAGCNFVTNLACSYTLKYVIWANAEIGWESWSANGFAMRLFAGFGHGFSAAQGFNLPYVGLSLGYSWL